MASLGVCALLRTKTDQCVQTSQVHLLLRAKTGCSQTSVQLPRCLQIAVLLITFLNFKNTLPKNAFFFYFKKKTGLCFNFGLAFKESFVFRSHNCGLLKNGLSSVVRI